MQVLSGTFPPVKTEMTETADVASLLHARVNGNGHARVARNGGNGHRRRVRHQIHHGYRRTALRADTAVTLVKNGMSVTEAIEHLGISSAHFYAMKAVRESEDP